MGLIYRRFLDGEGATRIFGCSECRTHLSTNDEVLSKAFQGQYGRGYLFSKVVNVFEGPLEERSMTTGLHSVRDVYCSSCNTLIGWKYERAYSEDQRYKEGKYILEKQLLTEVA
ncbi:peptidylprolyl isomerase [Hyaloraphidium curvatum]|nr:peptidylprolyl isomerase [Hyaloraphidium curvatum]